MTTTHLYYEQNAQQYFDSTKGLDLTELHETFLAVIGKGGHILDAGCGSGRDSKAFMDAGYRVTSIDSSPALARLASQAIGTDVSVETLEEYDPDCLFNGIWACASLLHVPERIMARTWHRLWAKLHPGGAFYASYKVGHGERILEGRQFTDATVARLRSWTSELEGMRSRKFWLSSDKVPGRNEEWINALVVKA